jgi:hypothetical protein
MNRVPIFIYLMYIQPGIEFLITGAVMITLLPIVPPIFGSEFTAIICDNLECQIPGSQGKEDGFPV